MRVGFALLAASAALLSSPRSARACGSSGPDGVSACSLAEYAEAQRPRWRVGVSGLYTSTVIEFTSGLRTGETRYAALAEASYSPTSRLSVSVGLGSAIGGKLLAPDGTNDIKPGLAASVGAAYRIADGATPVGHAFFLMSGLVSYTAATTELGNTGPSVSYDALDFRIAAVGGLTWLRTLSGYVVVRAFGGPAFWSYQGAFELGTDTHHYQVGGGLALLIARRVDLFAEGVPLGEQAVSAGVSVVF
jgi:hypothetical protein